MDDKLKDLIDELIKASMWAEHVGQIFGRANMDARVNLRNSRAALVAYVESIRKERDEARKAADDR